MSQAIYVNLDGGDVPCHLMSPSMPSDSIVRCDFSEVELALLAGGMESGAHSIAIFAKLPDGRVCMLELSNKNFMVAANAVRGRMVYLGIIPQEENPGIAFSVMPDRKSIIFNSEIPLQHWRYTKEHAKKFLSLLKQFTEELL